MNIHNPPLSIRSLHEYYNTNILVSRVLQHKHFRLSSRPYYNTDILDSRILTECDASLSEVQFQWGSRDDHVVTVLDVKDDVHGGNTCHLTSTGDRHLERYNGRHEEDVKKT